MSLILLDRTKKTLEGTISRTQFAYRPNRSTGDIALAHKLLMGAAIEKGLYTVCIGFDMSRAFDTVPRKKIIEVLQQKSIDLGDINIINTLLNNTIYM